MANGSDDTQAPSSGASASDASSAGSPERPRRPRRAAPTIDLSAKEIPDDAAEKASSDNTFDQQADARIRSRARFTMSDTFSASTIAAGLAGGLLVSILLFALWLTGMVPIRYAGSTAMRSRVSTLEMQVSELSKNNPASDNKAVEELAQRVAKLESAGPAAAADPKLLERVESAENAMKALGVALAALSGRVEANGARVDAAEKAAAEGSRASATSDGALGSRVEALEKAIAEANTAATKAKTDERAARYAVAASALRDAVLSGEAFAGELAAVKSLGAEAATLSPLQAFAERGVPREAALARELSALLPQIAKLAQADNAQGGGFIDKLQANAAKLVRVRPAGDHASSDPASIVARIETKAAANDVAGAQADLKQLPAAMRAPAEDWIKKVDARRAALDASRKLATDSVKALP